MPRKVPGRPRIQRSAPTPGAGRVRMMESIEKHKEAITRLEEKIKAYDERSHKRANHIPKAIVDGFRKTLERLGDESLRQRAAWYGSLDANGKGRQELIDAMVKEEFQQ